jgi:FkbM family methyltransferase
MLRSRIVLTARQLVDLAPPKLSLAAVDAIEGRSGEAELRLLPALVRPGESSGDVGANRGLYARRLARLCPLVLAFEPQPWLAVRLARATPDNVVVFPVALSGTGGEATLKVPRIGSVAAHTRATLGESDGDHIEQTVFRLRLDDLGLASLGFVKIDVEGHEMDLLDGAMSTIERCRPRLLVECDARSGAHPSEVLDHLAALGYEGWFHHSNDILPVSEFDVEKHQGERKEFGGPHPRGLAMNFMFLPTSEAGAVTGALRALIRPSGR